MITGENRPRTMKANNLSSPAFVLGKVNGCTGYIVLDAVIRLPGPPEIVAFLKYLLCVRLGKEVFVKRAEASAK